ncbi:hypothetical protein CONPUDRAFT_94120 [Coniophora puteana RWD-64-598 SS2]|uniref:Uncharacterized protein n=1 Tax=Coniophora puteana (strain RWD-64-598) TaxID=741705 RepID=R7SCK0_CONPW|nr:hypothetical protein CONPUDRAFT_94120 [Coniophora puteana RWD-64-598 SS2]
MCRSAPYEKSKSLGSGGSMVARLKLKGIDGRAPPGRVFFPWPEGLGNLVKLCRAGDRALQLLLFNEEFLVSVSHQLALITSLPFVHTARRYYRLNGLVRSSDWPRGAGNGISWLKS